MTAISVGVSSVGAWRDEYPMYVRPHVPICQEGPLKTHPRFPLEWDVLKTESGTEAQLPCCMKHGRCNQLWQLQQQQIQLQKKKSQILAQLNKLQALDRFHKGSGKSGVCGSTSHGERHLRRSKYSIGCSTDQGAPCKSQDITSRSFPTGPGNKILSSRLGFEAPPPTES